MVFRGKKKASKWDKQRGQKKQKRHSRDTLVQWFTRTDRHTIRPITHTDKRNGTHLQTASSYRHFTFLYPLLRRKSAGTIHSPSGFCEDTDGLTEHLQHFLDILTKTEFGCNPQAGLETFGERSN